MRPDRSGGDEAVAAGLADAGSAAERLYRADEAAVFGLDRIAPLPKGDVQAPGWSAVVHEYGEYGEPGEPGQGDRHAPPRLVMADPKAADAADIEDLTESLTSDECDAAAAFSAVPEELLAASVSSDRVTTMVRLPGMAAWPPKPPERAGRTGMTWPAVTLLTPPGPLLSPARGPEEPAPGPPARAMRLGVVRWGVFGAAVGLSLGAALLLGRWRFAEERSFQRTVRAVRLSNARPAQSASGPDVLLEQAAVALRDHHREQALALLLRYQVSESDHAVEILIRVLKKDLQKGLPPAGSRPP